MWPTTKPNHQAGRHTRHADVELVSQSPTLGQCKFTYKCKLKLVDWIAKEHGRDQQTDIEN